MEEDNLVEHDITRHFHYLRKFREWGDILPLIRPLPKGPPPLQAPDMLAYEQGRYVTDHVLPGVPGERRLRAELRRCPKLSFMHIDRRGIQGHVDQLVRIADAFAPHPDLIDAVRRDAMHAEKRTQRERSALGVERKKARRHIDPPRSR
jgi:hypothetical protein